MALGTLERITTRLLTADENFEVEELIKKYMK